MFDLRIIAKLDVESFHLANPFRVLGVITQPNGGFAQIVAHLVQPPCLIVEKLLNADQKLFDLVEIALHRVAADTFFTQAAAAVVADTGQ